jgi:O-methyltransferase
MVNSFMRTLRSFLKRFFRNLGYDFHRITPEGSEYERILPESRYAPWKTDRSFQNVYRTIEPNTLVDIYRCYELWSLVEQSKKLEGGLLEVGVWRGGTGALIAQRARLCGIEDSVYLCDTFRGIVKASSHDSQKDGSYADASAVIVKRFLDRLELKNVIVLEGMFPEETSKQVTEKKFRFCHIDVDVYQSATDVLDWVWEKLVVGGIVVYDDYGSEGCEGVTKHVREQMSKSDRLVLHNLNGHAIIIKTK